MKGSNVVYLYVAGWSVGWLVEWLLATIWLLASRSCDFDALNYISALAGVKWCNLCQSPWLFMFGNVYASVAMARERMTLVPAIDLIGAYSSLVSE